jgi:nucleotide-binding universal stress UspA family protein
MKSNDTMILICYDGSPDARAAVDHAGRLMAGSEATVLVVWETILETMTRSGSLGMGFGMVGPYGDQDDADAATEKAAQATADEGVQRAIDAGLTGRPLTARRSEDIAAVVLGAARDVDADVIVLGTRGLSGVKSLMLGSVSHAVVHRADRAVLVVPSPAVIEGRQRWAEHVRVGAGVA